MPKESRKRSRSKSPSSKKSRTRDRSPGRDRRDRRSPGRDRRDRRSPGRERRRSRSRDRRRHEERGKRRSNSDSKSPSPSSTPATSSSSGTTTTTTTTSTTSKSKSRGNSLGPTEPGITIEGAIKLKDEEGPLDNEAEQKRLETEMQKRRERIEKWRAEKKARDMGLIAGTAGIPVVGEKKASTPVPKSTKKWNLSDDEEDDDDVDGGGGGGGGGGEPPTKVKKEEAAGQENGGGGGEKDVKIERKEESEEEVDPLDAYMMGIQKEVKKFGSKAKPVVIKGGFKKTTTELNGPKKSTPTPTTVKVEVKKEITDDDDDVKTGKTESSAESNGGTGIKPLMELKKAKMVSIVSGIAIKNANVKKKGELIEQNQDALEYSSEEEEESVETLMDNLEKKNKKDFSFLDHNKIEHEYKEFRKDFYIEVPEIANMTPEEVNAYKVELENIKVLGKNVPAPIKSWVQCGISNKELQVIKKMNFVKPTPIQAQAIPCIMSGRDVIGIAKTGSGKTLAFLLPLFRHVLDQPPLEEEDGPIAVIMTPTRELAMQISKDCRKFCKYLDLNVVCVYGGTGISEQIAELKKGTEIIVCTPGRMIDMLAANSGRVTNLKRVTYIVMDEADRMFDLGFEPQVMRIIDNARPDRQIVLFSATFPRQMEAMARRLLVRPVEIQVGGRSVVGKDISQSVHITEDDDQKYLKLLELMGIYGEQGSIIIFVDKQEAADELCKKLISASYSSRPLHGGINQDDRDSTMSDFKSGDVKILIATSVASRGLDVKQLILVVNYDCPNHYEDYVHRCGRTGRAGNKGFAHTFLNMDQGRYAGHLIQALEFSERPVPPELKKLWEEYVIARKAEGKDVSKGGGFGGRGFKFDDTEEQLCVDRKKLQKAALGMHDSDDEDGGKDIDQQIADMFSEKKAVREVEKPLVAPDAATKNLKEGTAVNKDKLAKAKELASRLNLTRKPADEVDIMQQATSAVLKGDVRSLLNPMSGRNLAETLADKINAKLGYTAPVPSLMSLDVGLGVPEPMEGSSTGGSNAATATRYELELEINDFPQTARWRVTSREALNRISEFSEAGITVRGNYILPGKEPKGEERKLYLAIESLNELAVDRAKLEIQRLIKEELVRLQNSYQPQSKGRYKLT